MKYVYLGMSVLAVIVSFSLGLYTGSSATAAVKDAIVEVTDDHVDDAAGRLGSWANSIGTAAAEEYEARKTTNCDDYED